MISKSVYSLSGLASKDRLSTVIQSQEEEVAKAEQRLFLRILVF